MIRSFGILCFIIGAHLFAQVKIMPVGDSITWGKVNKAPPPGATEGYRDLLHTKLTNEGLSSVFVGPDGSALNHGLFLDGGTIGDFLSPDSAKGDIADALSTYKPEIVILHIGTNNISSVQPIGDYATPNSIMNQMYLMLNKITNNVDVKNLILCKVIPNYTSIGTDIKTQDFNNALEILLDELTSDQKAKITLVDMHTPFVANKLTYYNIDLDKVHPNGTGYAAMANIFYYYISKIQKPSYTDEFDRAAIGADWVVRSGVQIVNKGESGGGALQCTSTGTDDWTHMAIWNKTKNLTTVSMKLHADCTDNAADKVGILVGLDSNTLTANGYLIWIYNNTLSIKTVVAGKGGYGIGQLVTSWPLTNLKANDILKVGYRQAPDANYFTISVNGGPTIQLRDQLRRAGNSADLYSGIMFNQAEVLPIYSVFIDWFLVEAQLPDVIPPGRIYDLSLEFTTNTSITLGWTAPGNDDYIGTASTYDLRYSKNPIVTESDFANANIVSGMSAPKENGTKETFTVGGLQSGTGYYFNMRAIDSWGNKGELADAVYARTNSAGEISETFDRPTEPDGSIGPDWVIDGNEYRIDYNPTTKEGEFNNYQSDGEWGRLAVYRGRSNPSIVKLVWGRNATTDGIGQGGLALMLTNPTLSADGYLLWIRTQRNEIYLFNIDKGLVQSPPDGLIDLVPYTLKDGSGNIRPPQRGDTMAVVMDWNYLGGFKFDLSLNGLPISERALFDSKQRHNSSTKYAGLMLGRNNKTNNVTEFITVSEYTGASNIQVLQGDGLSGMVGTQLTDSLKVRVLDANNTPLPGMPVWFKVLEPVDASVTAPQEPLDPIQIEAEWGIFTGTYFTRNDEPGASGGEYIVSPLRGAYSGIATYTVYVEKDTTYWFWNRLISPDDQHYALVFQVDNNPEWLWGALQGQHSSQWQWDRVRNGAAAASLRLSRGLHKIYVKSAHDQVKVDKILLTSRSNFIPTTQEFVPQLLTNQEGVAGTLLTLSTKAGPNRVQVKCFGTADRKEFVDTGLPSAPVLMEKSNDAQSGAARTTLAKPFIVTLKDQFGNKTPNAVVNFLVTEGDGTLSAAKDTTDVNGQASTRLTLGIQSSTYKVKTTFTGYAGPDVIFTATATTGLVRRILGIPVVIPGKHYVGAVLPNFIKAQVLDDAGVPVADVPVTFQVVKGSASPVYSRASGRTCRASFSTR